MKQNSVLIIAVIAVVLLATGAGAYYIGNAEPSPKVVAKAPVRHTVQQAQTQPQLPPCDDKNIVGTALGAVGGGVVGSQFGKGSGKTAATIGGVVAGGVAGNQLIPTRNVTCR